MVAGLDPLSHPRLFPEVVVNAQLFRFRQDYPDKYRPWQGSIRLYQVFGADWGIGSGARLPVTKESLLIKIPLFPELVEEGIVVFSLGVKCFGRIYPETTWSISGEVLY